MGQAFSAYPAAASCSITCIYPLVNVSVKISKHCPHGHLSNFHLLLFTTPPPPPLFLANSAIVISLWKLTFCAKKSHSIIHRMHLVVFFQYFIHFPLFLITISIRFGIERIKLFTALTGMEWNVLITQFLNCANVCRRTCCCNACLFNILLTMGNTFSMTARSRDLGHSLINVLFIRCIAARAEAEFWKGSPSSKNIWVHPLSELRTGDQNGYL